MIAWMRDVGPSFVVTRAARCAVCTGASMPGVGCEGACTRHGIRMNSWPLKVLEIEGRDRYCAPLINEGGAIHVDGAGTALVTEECLLNANRNPTLNRARIEAHLRAYLGVSTIVWLGRGVCQR